MSFLLRPLAAFCLLLAAGAAPALAVEQMPPAVAAVIDYQRVLREAKAAKSIRDQIETRRKL
jgi:Skp family chaperone for outer membrane proteins